MDVTWLGHGCFRLRGRGAAVVTDPYPPAIGLKLGRMDAEVVTISHEHDNHNSAQVVRDGAYEIHGPGEYEIAGVKTRFNQVSAVIAGPRGAGLSFVSGVTLYRVKNGVIDAGQFIPLDAGR